MTNPFLEIEEKLTNIEKKQTNIENLILGMQPQIEPSPKTEQPISQSAAEIFLGKTKQTLITWRKKEYITAYHIGNRVYYLPSELLSALKKLG